VARARAAEQRGAELSGIVALSDRIAGLAPDARARTERLLDVDVITSHTDPPSSMTDWLTRTFGSVDAVREQRLVRVTNLATLESTVFAALRARRPIESNGTGSAGGLAAEIEATKDDPFCHPEAETPADTFGRVRGRRMLTGANVAQADAHHAVLVFDEHDPLAFDGALIDDLFATGREWAGRARTDDPEAVHYLLIWNCLWRAGGSIVHGHAQALLGRRRPHARLARFRRDAAAYAASTGTDLVGDVVAIHRDLGLALDSRGGVTVLANLVPTKENEVLVIGHAGMDERDPTFSQAVGQALQTLRDRVGVRSFNLALWRPPLDADDDPFPPIVRIVDRGDPASRPSDIGALELYGSPIVGSDPYDLVDALRAAG
jgi:hypothetical protein